MFSRAGIVVILLISFSSLFVSETGYASWLSLGGKRIEVVNGMISEKVIDEAIKYLQNLYDKDEYKKTYTYATEAIKRYQGPKLVDLEFIRGKAYFMDYYTREINWIRKDAFDSFMNIWTAYRDSDIVQNGKFGITLKKLCKILYKKLFTGSKLPAKIVTDLEKSLPFYGLYQEVTGEKLNIFENLLNKPINSSVTINKDKNFHMKQKYMKDSYDDFGSTYYNDYSKHYNPAEGDYKKGYLMLNFENENQYGPFVYCPAKHCTYPVNVVEGVNYNDPFTWFSNTPGIPGVNVSEIRSFVINALFGHSISLAYTKKLKRHSDIYEHAKLEDFYSKLLWLKEEKIKEINLDNKKFNKIGPLLSSYIDNNEDRNISGYILFKGKGRKGRINIKKFRIDNFNDHDLWVFWIRRSKTYVKWKEKMYHVVCSLSNIYVKDDINVSVEISTTYQDVIRIKHGSLYEWTGVDLPIDKDKEEEENKL